eukprot:CAMPEP_0197903236 /NCGR_PEP_ID=MMETSP1439-20131203/55485_1 /TAXON_ID=66791 /ORGANISM="Gonyaulax spinifera, Strain CCMP409" /LENGTH=49 /DNA_ID= /DNA_START= /DNA_END= /DNA_ORIENTATION=
MIAHSVKNIAKLFGKPRKPSDGSDLLARRSTWCQLLLGGKLQQAEEDRR